MKFGLCVIGCGNFARTFARQVQGELADLALYFASRDANRAAAFAAEFGGSGSFGAYESAVAAPEVDAVYICTPHHLHLPHARLAAAAGKHILIEKPLARDTAEAQAIIAAAADAGSTLMVAENYRFMPPVPAAKALLDGGRLGTLRLAQLQEQYPFQPTGWRHDARLNGGGTFIDGGIHKASILAYLAGPPAEIYAAAPPPRPGAGQPVAPDAPAAEDSVLAMLRYPDGMVGIINHSWSAAPHTPRPWAALTGTEASAMFDLGGNWIDVLDAAGRRRQWLDAADPTGIAAMTREFRESIRQRRPPAMTGADGARDVALVQAAYASIRAGAPVNFAAFWPP